MIKELPHKHLNINIYKSVSNDEQFHWFLNILKHLRFYNIQQISVYLSFFNTSNTDQTVPIEIKKETFILFILGIFTRVLKNQIVLYSQKLTFFVLNYF